MKDSKSKYADYLKTDYWKAVVQAVKQRAGYRCQLCNSQHDLQAHHRSYDHRGNELDHLDDLTCLCRRCHAVFHGVVAPIIQAPPPAALPPKANHAPSVEEKRLSKRQRREQRQAAYEKLTNVKAHTQEQVDAQMPEGTQDPIILTRDLINRCRANGAFTAVTIDAFGVRDKMFHGWVDRLIGEALPRAKYREAIEGRYIYAKRCFEKV